MVPIESRMKEIESMGQTFIDGYAIPEMWIDLVSDEVPAADVAAIAVVFGGFREIYDKQTRDEAEYRHTSFALDDARSLVARNRMLRENSRQVPFDERYKFPVIAQGA